MRTLVRLDAWQSVVFKKPRYAQNYSCQVNIRNSMPILKNELAAIVLPASLLAEWAGISSIYFSEAKKMTVEI